MAISRGLLRAKVMHHRLIPRRNRFVYGVYYLCFPLSVLPTLACGMLKTEKSGLLSFRARDYGARDGSDPEGWIRGVLAGQGLDQADGEIVLLTLPRVMGYLFNPVSFWFCLDKQGKLRAVLAEVSNTFSERHNYLVAHADQRPIEPDEWLECEKVFYVSPFLNVEGKYLFRFNYSNDSVGVWINYFTQKGKVLETFVGGPRVDLNVSSLRKVFFAFPLVTLKVIGLIHYQAIKLWIKKIKYVVRPKPPQELISR